MRFKIAWQKQVYSCTFFSIVIKYLLLDYEMFVFMNHQFIEVFGTNQIVGFL